jgi:glutamine---fructose-6-phosphate transaminase (isomerizing)
MDGKHVKLHPSSSLLYLFLIFAHSLSSLRCAAQVILGGLDTHKRDLIQIRNMLLTGCGTSKYASEYGAKLMRDMDCFETVCVLDSAEVLPPSLLLCQAHCHCPSLYQVRKSDLPKAHGGLMAVSQSGETKDVHRAVKIAMENDIPSLSVVNTVGSLIARTTQLGVYLQAGREHAVASTKAFSSQVTVLSLVALWFRHQRELKEGLPELHLKGELVEALQRLPISFGMGLKTRPKCQEIAKVRHHLRSLSPVTDVVLSTAVFLCRS